MAKKDTILLLRARKLRRQMTDAETTLWYEIRKDRFGVRFYRQRIFGKYIVDFYSPKARLVIELDGGQHFENEYQKRDKIRDDYLNSLGLMVLRFDNRQVLKEMGLVLEEINRVVEERVLTANSRTNPSKPPF
jgi:very-short-patch-repair endonuclease